MMISGWLVCAFNVWLVPNKRYFLKVGAISCQNTTSNSAFFPPFRASICKIRYNITKQQWYSLFNRIKELQEDEQTSLSSHNLSIRSNDKILSNAFNSLIYSRANDTDQFFRTERRD